MKIDTLFNLIFFLFFLYGLSILIKGIRINSYLKQKYPSKFIAMTENLPITKKILFFSEGTLPYFIYKSDEDWDDDKLNKMKKNIKRHFRILCTLCALYVAVYMVFFGYLYTSSPARFNIRWFGQ